MVLYIPVFSGMDNTQLCSENQGRFQYTAHLKKVLKADMPLTFCLSFSADLSTWT